MAAFLSAARSWGKKKEKLLYAGYKKSHSMCMQEELCRLL